MQYIWISLDTNFFLFAMNFILLARDKTKKYLPISQRIINYQTFFFARACITVYQLIQDHCSHSDTPLEKRAQKDSISVKWINSSKIQNCNGINTQYCMQKASFWCLILSLLLTKPVFQITYRDMVMLVILWNKISVECLRRN